MINIIEKNVVKIIRSKVKVPFNTLIVVQAKFLVITLDHILAIVLSMKISRDSIYH